MGQEPLIMLVGRWLTKRRSILFAPLFAAVLLAARIGKSPWSEVVLDAAGVVFVWAGTRLRLVAASYHESDYHSEPITAGPYAWIRHPLYLANFLLGMGIVMVAGWWPMMLAYVLVFIPIHAVIMKSEEVHLASLYGERYQAYRRAVPALLSWRPYVGPRYGQRSSFKIQKGMERWKAAGYFAGMAAILLVKQIRRAQVLPPLRPMPSALWVVCAGVAILAMVVRPKLRSSILRSAQTVLAVCAVLMMVAQLPGVWPAGVVRNDEDAQHR